MPNKINIICLKCGQVQVRTDIISTFTEKYTLSKNITCSNCAKKTIHVLTHNIKKLKKELKDGTTPLDKQIYHLIER